MGKYLGLILLCAHGIWKGTNALLAKVTVHTGMKGICEKFTVLTSGSSDVDHLKKLLKKKMDTSMILVSSEMHYCSLGGIVGQRNTGIGQLSVHEGLQV